MRILRATDHTAMPWKNGGGVTREVASAPALNESSPFVWRLSLATIRQSGPFSLFPGIDRTIAALRGDPVRLTIDGKEVAQLHALGEPFAFSGDAKVSAFTDGAETIDLNIMTLRGHAHHDMARLGWAGETTIETWHRLTMLVFTSAVRISSDAHAFEADVDDVIVDIPSETRLSLSSSGPAVAYVIGVDEH
ncbi:HutD/Ves family protein [Agrobacterium sp. ES01]|uniref:HutD/Ves family protein n=1 Tax=Agrobacterium sp. ES01 TaxID=3420714 RepID=UPI003D0B6C99